MPILADIETSHGDLNAPEELYRLEEAIDIATNSRRWVEACSFNYLLYCGYSPSFWFVAPIPLVLAVWIARQFVPKGRPFAGILRGQAIVFLFWVTEVLAISNGWIGNRSLSSVRFISVLGIIEFIAVLPIGLFLAWRHKQSANTSAQITGAG